MCCADARTLLLHNGETNWYYDCTREKNNILFVQNTRKRCVRLKITDITYDCVEVPYSQPFHPTWYPGKTEQGQIIFVVRVHTDEGITGYSCMEAPHGILPIVCDTMEYAKMFVVGDDPCDIEKIMPKLRNVARVATRPWVIENACWDIIGKKAGMPVYKILGAARDRSVGRHHPAPICCSSCPNGHVWQGAVPRYPVRYDPFQGYDGGIPPVHRCSDDRIPYGCRYVHG